MKQKYPKQMTPGSKILLVSVSLIIFLPILLIAAVFYIVWGCILYLSVWLTWRRQRVLFVYSDSPIWKEYIEREIIPNIKSRATILNWSERRTWKNSLPGFLFRYFGGDRNFNPIAIVFRPFRPVKTYRFYQAFKKFKHGHPQEVEEIKTRLFENLEIEKITITEN